MADMIEFKVYGASDDLIEITGDISEEISASYERPDYLMFQNGILLKLEYTRRGKWTIDVLNEPTLCSIEVVEASEESLNDYSQVARITTDENIEYVVTGSEIKTFN